VSVALFGLSVHLARRAEGVRGVVEPCTARDGENSYFDPHREGLGRTVAVTDQHDYTRLSKKIFRRGR
jgi:hypothetical protein